MKQLAEAALSVIARNGWKRTTLDAIAAKGRISLKACKSKNDVLPHIVRYMDEKMLDAIGDASDGSLHDRLFEILMARFDAFQGHRKAMLSIFGAMPTDPVAALRVIPCIRNSAGLVIARSGLTGCKVTNTLALLGVMAATARAWSGDDSADLSLTMSALDKHLTKAGKMGFLGE